MIDVKIEPSWKEQLQAEFAKPYFEQLTQFVRAEYGSKRIFPPAGLIFNAFAHTPFHRVKVVILGQDPYHGDGQAHGLSFSVPDGVPAPPSLLNIFKEIATDLGTPIPASGNLIRWADQGVLLLNASLTVVAHQANSHQNSGWHTFTDAVIRCLSAEREGIVFMLWGSFAQKKSELIDHARHCVLTAPHPSPLSAHRGFLGCKHFSRANSYLRQRGETEIVW